MMGLLISRLNVRGWRCSHGFLNAQISEITADLRSGKKCRLQRHFLFINIYPVGKSFSQIQSICDAVGMRIITPPLVTTIFQLFEYNLPSELARQAPAQPTIEDQQCLLYLSRTSCAACSSGHSGNALAKSSVSTHSALDARTSANIPLNCSTSLQIASQVGIKAMEAETRGTTEETPPRLEWPTFRLSTLAIEAFIDSYGPRCEEWRAGPLTGSTAEA
jgi:hypothetical protein